MDKKNKTVIETGWNYGPVDSSLIRNECLHHIFEETVDYYPHQTALVFGEASFTYEEIEVRANALARYLRSFGVGKGSKVGLYLSKSVELYIGMLAIMKAGAAYIPVDPTYPGDRTRYILEDSGVGALLVNNETAKNSLFDTIIVNLDDDRARIAQFSAERLPAAEVGVLATDLVYIMYTSGSTGKPKGVMIEHQSVCNLVRASQKTYGMTPQDKIYQGFSIAFDFSLEEIWMAFSNGATLIPATPEMLSAGPELSKLLSEAGVTALCCVPTLLAILDDDIPTLRFINVGGEDCPSSLISKWWRPSRRFFNTYGPTEATVNATYAECHPDKKVTIGRPLPNFTTYILDEHMQPVSAGKEGELYIGGIGLARGYVNRPDLTSEKFILNPFIASSSDSSRLYKSGDLVKYDDYGEIVYLGRIDTQIKIRGFRIELSEIEAVLVDVPNVQAVIASVYEKIPGLKSIAVYIVPKDEKVGIDINRVRNILKEMLPIYMLPQYIEIIYEIPRMPSGKIDRKKLPAPKTQQYFGSHSEIIAPKTVTEKIVVQLWKEIFSKKHISVADHFFYDLGGHSLFAAQAVSRLRSYSDIHDLSIADIYANPTIEALAAVIEKRKETLIPQGKKSEAKIPHPISRLKRVTHSLMQGLGIYIIYSLIALPFITFYLLSKPDQTHVFSLGISHTVLYLILTILAYLPFMSLISILAKWMIIGRFKAGEYPLWGSYYFRFWLVHRIQSLVPMHYLIGTPWLGMYFRLMGAKIGKNCFLSTPLVQMYDLLTIGDNTSVGVASQLLGYTVEGGFLKIAPITIGHNCFIGTHTVISHGAIMEDGARLDDLSMVSVGTTIPAGEYWSGSPADKAEQSDIDLDAMADDLTGPSARSMGYGFFYGVIILLLPLVTLIPYLPVGFVLFSIYYKIGYWSILVTLLLAPLYIALLSAEIVLLKKILFSRITAGMYPVDSLFFIRKWAVDQLISISLLSMNTLFATLYTPIFLRLLGAKIGKRVEISTVAHIAPDLLQVNDESFVADLASLGAPKVYMGKIMLGATIIGQRTFIGNAAMVSSNTILGNGCLIGVLSTAPKNGLCKDNTSWLGLPPIFLPKRDINTSFTEGETYVASRALYAKRYFIEFFRVTLPTAINLSVYLLSLFLFDFFYGRLSPVVMIFSLSMIILLSQLVGMLGVVILKWIIVGQYIPRIRPLWSTFVWRSELITGLYEDVVAAPLLRNFLGTPFAPWILRFFGVKIGERVYVDTTFVTEFDLVKVGSDAAINFDCSLQTHLFEDRVMKMSYVDVGDGCTVGSRSVVLYDTKMNKGANIHALSLLMKGESLLANTDWEGVPARNC